MTEELLESGNTAGLCAFRVFATLVARGELYYIGARRVNDYSFRTRQRADFTGD
jgi:hypothetical protein